MFVVYQSAKDPRCKESISILKAKGEPFSLIDADDATVNKLKRAYGPQMPMALPYVLENGFMLGSLEELKLRLGFQLDNV